VDALLPALEHLQSHPKTSINEILDELLAASAVAEEGAEKTAGMRARFPFKVLQWQRSFIINKMLTIQGRKS
jgi:hypothetical protein